MRTRPIAVDIWPSSSLSQERQMDRPCVGTESNKKPKNAFWSRRINYCRHGTENCKLHRTWYHRLIIRQQTTLLKQKTIEIRHTTRLSVSCLLSRRQVYMVEDDQGDVRRDATTKNFLHEAVKIKTYSLYGITHKRRAQPTKKSEMKKQLVDTEHW